MVLYLACELEVGIRCLPVTGALPSCVAFLQRSWMTCNEAVVGKTLVHQAPSGDDGSCSHFASVKHHATPSEPHVIVD